MTQKVLELGVFGGVCDEGNFLWCMTILLSPHSPKRGWLCHSSGRRGLRVEPSSGGLDFGAVAETGVPAAPALGREIHEVPDRSEQVDATLLNVGSHPGMRCVKVTDGAAGVAGENGQG